MNKTHTTPRTFPTKRAPIVELGAAAEADILQAGSEAKEGGVGRRCGTGLEGAPGFVRPASLPCYAFAFTTALNAAPEEDFEGE